MKDVSCVGRLNSVNLVTNVPTAAIDLHVMARLHQFWEKWETLGASPKVVTVLRQGYTLPFRFRPNLTRSPTVVSSYTNPDKNLNLLEALYQLVNKNAVELVENQNSLGFYNRLFLVPKPNNLWRLILDLSTLNTFLNTESFKMETPETRRTSLQTGEWVTSIDFKDAYFHIPIHSQSRNYMRFHVQGCSYQFKALPFGLSTAPMEFTVVVRDPSDGFTEGYKNPPVPRRLVGESHIPPNLCPAYTDLGSSLSRTRLAEQGKVRAGSKTVFKFVGYQFDIAEGKVRPTPECWQALTDKIQSILSGLVCPVWQFMSLIGLLTATEKQVHLGRLHMRPIQWNLKNNWRVPESLERVIPVPGPSTPLKVVAGGKQCATRSTITPTCSANIYRRIKRWVGHSARGAYCKGNLVPYNPWN